jgi:hypothetical protein
MPSLRGSQAHSEGIRGASVRNVPSCPKGREAEEERTTRPYHMSNWKHAYGWSGHILVRQSDEEEGDPALNVIPVPDDIFDRIVADMESCNLPAGVHVEQLGVLSEDTVFSLAAGTGFTEGWKWYGAPFEEAELRLERDPLKVDIDAVYLAVIRDHYGLTLPPCRLMIGCSSEN